MLILAGCLDLRYVLMQGLISSAAKALPNLPSDTPVSLLGHVEAARVNM